MKPRILIIEDNSERMEKIRQWLPEDVVPLFAASAGMAIGVIQRDAKALAGIMLDHDLQEHALTQADRLLSGASLVALIARKVQRHVPILVHSMNVTGSLAMTRRLKAAGFSVQRIPMADLTIDRLAAWVDDVRENWDVE